MAKLRHIAMVVEDMEGESKKAEASGAVRCGSIMLAASEGGRETERKFRDPNGQVFDLTSPEYARDFWRVAV